MENAPFFCAMYQRYFLRIAYDGTKYHGWQRQPNGHSVQQEIENALARILRLPRVVTTGCGRTDAGVHAQDYYLHFDPEMHGMDTQDTLFKLGHVLNKDVSPLELFPVHSMAHTRYDAIEREYEYHVHLKRNPFVRLHSTYFHKSLDVDLMNEAAQYLIFQGDFGSFSKAGGGQKTNICDVRSAIWTQQGDRLIFRITADRFLRNMIRAVVGTMFDVGQGKITPEDFKAIIDSQDRNQAGDSARPEGLRLSRIKYAYINENGYCPELAARYIMSKRKEYVPGQFDEIK